MCDRDIATNFGAVSGEVIFVDSCACIVIFISNDDLREMMKTLASNTVTLQQNVMSFQQETKSSIHNLEKKMGQVASSVGKLEAQMNGKFPSQALNLKENVSVITL